MLSLFGVVLPVAMPAVVEASPTTIYVPGDYLTIQAAVNAANASDTIMVGDGTYIENVNVTKSLTINSVNGTAFTTVQADNPSDHVFEVTADNVTIDGFTVTGASADYKAGIYLEIDVEHCTISNNTAMSTTTPLTRVTPVAKVYT